MSCSCQTTVLRIFIRSIARLRIDPVLRNPASRTLLGSSYKQFSLLTQRSQRAATAIEDSSSEEWPAIDRSTLDDIKIPEKSAKWSKTTLKPGTNASNLQGNEKVRAWSRGDMTKEQVNEELRGAQDYSQNESNLTSPYDAVLEIIPESIEALASGSLEDSAIQQPERSGRGLALRNGFRPDESSSSRQYRRDSRPADRHARSAAAEEEVAYTPKESWQIQKAALKEKFAEGWNPRKRLSPDALKGIRAIHAQYPHVYTTAVLAEKFEVSAEAIRRILKSKWTPKEEEEADRTRRWHVRGTKVWSRWADLGMKPPARWRSVGVGRGESHRDRLEQHARESNSFRDRQAVVRVGGERRQGAQMDLTTEPAQWVRNSSR